MLGEANAKFCETKLGSFDNFTSGDAACRHELGRHGTGMTYSTV